ncbi:MULTISPECIES: hypothetical protein [Pseudomonas]|uniref:hypothetical protein n=1 Tax=Pseudomonas TaxID=286 RepID=UPI000A92351E|nr:MULTISPECIES: hypothetical protein [Pseudomonas]
MSWSVKVAREAKRRLVLEKWVEHVAQAKAAGEKPNKRKFVMDSKGEPYETNITSLNSWIDRYAIHYPGTSRTGAANTKEVSTSYVNSVAALEDDFKTFLTERRQSENLYRLDFCRGQQKLLRALLAEIDRQILELETKLASKPKEHRK